MLLLVVVVVVEGEKQRQNDVSVACLPMLNFPPILFLTLGCVIFAKENKTSSKSSIAPRASSIINRQSS